MCEILRKCLARVQTKDQKYVYNPTKIESKLKERVLKSNSRLYGIISDFP